MEETWWWGSREWWLEGNHVSSSDSINWDEGWYLLFAAAHLNIIVGFMTSSSICKEMQGLPVLFVFSVTYEQSSRDQVMTCDKKFVWGPLPWMWGGEGGEINHLSVKRLQRGTWLYEEREDWEHSLVSSSCMQTSSCEGGESTHKAVRFASGGFMFTMEKGAWGKLKNPPENFKWPSCGKWRDSFGTMEQLNMLLKMPKSSCFMIWEMGVRFWPTFGSSV